MEKSCFICEIPESKAKLVHAINGKEIILACERCVASEDLLVVKRPTEEQIAFANKPYTVKERLAKAMNAGRAEQAKPQVSSFNAPKLYCLSRLHNVELPIKLVENFNWVILRARKAKKLNQNQVAQAIQEPIAELKILESGCLSDNSEKIINKLEQYFHIQLRANKPLEDELTGKAIINKDTVKTLTVGDLIRAKREIEERKNMPEIENKESMIGDEVEIEEDN